MQTLTLSLRTRPVTGTLLERIITGIRWWTRLKCQVSIGLKIDADYCDITERFLEIVDRFLADVERRTRLSRVKWGGASLNPRNFAR